MSHKSALSSYVALNSVHLVRKLQTRYCLQCRLSCFFYCLCFFIFSWFEDVPQTHGATICVRSTLTYGCGIHWYVSTHSGIRQAKLVTAQRWNGKHSWTSPTPFCVVILGRTTKRTCIHTKDKIEISFPLMPLRLTVLRWSLSISGQCNNLKATASHSNNEAYKQRVV